MSRYPNIQLCVGVLDILSQKGLSKIANIMYALNTNHNSLIENLSFLSEQRLVEKKSIGKNRDGFLITKQGSIVLDSIKILKMQ